MSGTIKDRALTIRRAIEPIAERNATGSDLKALTLALADLSKVVADLVDEVDQLRRAK